MRFHWKKVDLFSIFRELFEYKNSRLKILCENSSPRNGSVLVGLSLVLYKMVPVYMHICHGYLQDTYSYICTIIVNMYESCSLEVE